MVQKQIHFLKSIVVKLHNYCLYYTCWNTKREVCFAVSGFLYFWKQSHIRGTLMVKNSLQYLGWHETGVSLLNFENNFFLWKIRNIFQHCSFVNHTKKYRRYFLFSVLYNPYLSISELILDIVLLENNIILITFSYKATVKIQYSCKFPWFIAQLHWIKQRNLWMEVLLLCIAFHPDTLHLCVQFTECASVLNNCCLVWCFYDGKKICIANSVCACSIVTTWWKICNLWNSYIGLVM
jgi:hypothetical protein